MQLHIRPGTDADLPELIVIQALAIATFYHDAYTPEQLTCLTERQATGMNPQHQAFVVAEVNGASVGFAALSAFSAIDAVYIHPQWMRQGIGTQLVAALEEIALQKRCVKLSVIAAVTASGFYQSLGYQILAPCDYALETVDSVPCHLLQKRLRDSKELEPWERKALCWVLGFVVLVALRLGINYWKHYQVPREASPLYSSPSNVTN
jgi:N-acetylglutamate synthase-like GNAT family acetyltransferase